MCAAADIQRPPFSATPFCVCLCVPTTARRPFVSPLFFFFLFVGPQMSSEIKRTEDRPARSCRSTRRRPTSSHHLQLAVLTPGFRHARSLLWPQTGLPASTALLWRHLSDVCSLMYRRESDTPHPQHENVLTLVQKEHTLILHAPVQKLVLKEMLCSQSLLRLLYLHHNIDLRRISPKCDLRYELCQATRVLREIFVTATMSMLSNKVVGYRGMVSSKCITMRTTGKQACPDPDRQFLALRPERKTLAILLDQPEYPLTPLSAKSILAGVAEGLHDMHRHHMLHCDLKPANILVRDGRVGLLCDFGLSQCVRHPRRGGPMGTSSTMSDESRTLLAATVSWSVGGLHAAEVCTSPYRPPELLAHQWLSGSSTLSDGRKTRTEYGYEVDMWALGCVMLEMALGGEMAFHVKDTSSVDGHSQQLQLHRIFCVLGKPSHDLCRHMISDPAVREAWLLARRQAEAKRRRVARLPPRPQLFRQQQPLLLMPSPQAVPVVAMDLSFLADSAPSSPLTSSQQSMLPLLPMAGSPTDSARSFSQEITTPSPLSETSLRVNSYDDSAMPRCSSVCTRVGDPSPWTPPASITCPSIRLPCGIQIGTPAAARPIEVCPSQYDWNEVVATTKTPGAADLQARLPDRYTQAVTSLFGLDGLDLLAGLLAYDPLHRLSSQEALEHPFFTRPV